MSCAHCNDPATAVQYQYDGLNQRVARLSGGIKTYEFYGSAGSLLVEYSPNLSNRLVEYIHLGNKRIAQVEPTATTVVPPGGGAGLTAFVGRQSNLAATIVGSSPTGTASLTTTFSTAGPRTITAAYSGDAANAPSSSTVVLMVVVAPEELVPIIDLLLN
jgi:Bacterial Ig-like domain (group 3)